MLAQVVLILALLLIFVGMIMVMLDAFNESFLWGLLVLLVPPIFVPIYSFVKWNKSQARNGFAMVLIGLVMAAVGVYGGGLHGLPLLGDSEMVSHIPTATPEDDTLSNEEEASQVELEDGESYDPILSTDKDRFSSKDIEPLAPKEDKSVKNFGAEKAHAVNVPLEEISSSMGANVEITLKDGAKHSGTLVHTTEDSISLEQQTGGGTISFEYGLDKIESVTRYSRPNNSTVPPVVGSGEQTDEYGLDKIEPETKYSRPNNSTAQPVVESGEQTE